MLISLQSQLIYCPFRNGLCYQFLHTNANTVKVDLQIAIGCIESIQDPEHIDQIMFKERGKTSKRKLSDELYEDSGAHM